MTAKVTEIKLTDGHREALFPIDVAEELLSWPRCGWSLSDGSGYEYRGGRLVRVVVARTKAEKE